MNKPSKKKPLTILIGFMGAVVIAVGAVVFFANYRPAPSAATLALASEAKAIYDLDIQLTTAGTLGMRNSNISRVRTMAAELQDYATNQKHVLHAWFNKNNVLLEQVSVPAGDELTLTNGYVQKLVNRTGTDWDAAFNHYLADLYAKLQGIDRKVRFAKKPIGVEFTKTTNEVNAIINLIK